MIQVSEGLYRGPRPKDFRVLKEMGVVWVINLQSGIYELFHEDQYERQHAYQFGMFEMDYGLSDFTAPDSVIVHEAIDLIKQCVDAKQRVYVHCKFGADRTGFVIAAYRIKHMGWSFEKAVAEMFALGFHKFPYLWWVPSLKSYVPEFEPKMANVR